MADQSAAGISINSMCSRRTFGSGPPSRSAKEQRLIRLAVAHECHIDWQSDLLRRRVCLSVDAVRLRTAADRAQPLREGCSGDVLEQREPAVGSLKAGAG